MSEARDKLADAFRAYERSVAGALERLWHAEREVQAAIKEATADRDLARTQRDLALARLDSEGGPQAAAAAGGPQLETRP